MYLVYFSWFMGESVKLPVWQTTFGWVLCSEFASDFLCKGVIRQGDSAWKRVSRGVWGVVPGRREGQGQSSRLDTHRGSGAKLCREQISRPWQLLNNLPWSAGLLRFCISLESCTIGSPGGRDLSWHLFFSWFCIFAWGCLAILNVPYQKRRPQAF